MAKRKAGSNAGRDAPSPPKPPRKKRRRTRPTKPGNESLSTASLCRFRLDDRTAEPSCNLRIAIPSLDLDKTMTDKKPSGGGSDSGTPILEHAANNTKCIPFSGPIQRSSSSETERNRDGDSDASKIDIGMGLLSCRETELWSSSLGAFYAAKGSLPGHVCRKLGKITRTLWLPPGDLTRDCGKSLSLGPNDSKQKQKQKQKQKPIPPPTLARAKKEVREQCASPKDNFEAIERKARALIRDWKESLSSNHGDLVPLWNQHGEIPLVPNWEGAGTGIGIGTPSIAGSGTRNATNQHHVPMTAPLSMRAIRSKLESNRWRERPAKRNTNCHTLYHLNIPTDVRSVLLALETLADPDPLLYNLPLVVAMPVLEPIDGEDTSDHHPGGLLLLQPFRLTLCVYAHRLLFECMTTDALRTVMAALDDDEEGAAGAGAGAATKSRNPNGNERDHATIVRPLVRAPAFGPPVFGTDPNAKVVVELQTEGEQTGDSKNDPSMVDWAEGTSGSNGEGCPTRNNDVLDAFSTEGFLKLIENKGVSGVDSVYQKTIRPILYGSNENSRNHRHHHQQQQHQQHQQQPLLKVALLPHQVHGVCWMYQMEHLENPVADSNQQHPSLGINGLLWETRRFREGDVFYYSPALGQARLRLGDGPWTGRGRGSGSGRATGSFSKPQKFPRGGILADEMGLGKTVQAIALVLATLGELKQEAKALKEQQDGGMDGGVDGVNCSHATLIVVPPALVGQWRNEIRKIAGTRLRVQMLDRHYTSNKHSTDTVEDEKEDGIPRVSLDPFADVVLTTYPSLQEGSGGKSQKKKRKGDKTATNHKNAAVANAISDLLLSTVWGRIVLDEMQEVRSWNTVVSKNCQQLVSHRRWMLSGTPLWEGIHDFRGELCFLGLEPFAANNEDGFFDFAVARHWEERSVYGLEILKLLALVVLRRTKSMSILQTGLPLLGLKNLNLVFEPVPQDPSERALYCCLESIMHATLQAEGDESSLRNTGRQAARLFKQNRANRGLFLRLLRELCVSFYLLNGGVGCPSQLKDLNRLTKEYNRNRLARERGNNRSNARYSLDGFLSSSSSSSSDIWSNGSSNNSVGSTINENCYSCDEAIRFLSQVEDVARTDSDFVTDQTVGGGGGLGRRNRALLIQPLEQLEASSAVLARSRTICEDARSARARAHWHLALEGVTTGRLLEDASDHHRISKSVLCLWKWRRSQCWWQEGGDNFNDNQYKLVPSWARRGFRPNRDFFDCLMGDVDTECSNDRTERLWVLHRHRSDFRWAHPFSLVFSLIPVQVTEHGLRTWLENVLAAQARKKASSSSSSPLSSARIFRLNESQESQTWEAMIHFPTRNDFDWFELRTKRVHGLKLPVEKKIPHIEQEIATRKKAADDAEAMRIVHPSTQNERNLTKARAAYEKAKLGLCITARANHRPGHVMCSRAFGAFRGEGPKTSEALNISLAQRILVATTELAEHTAIVAREERTIRSIKEKLETNASGTAAVENLNTFDVLQALKKGESEKTNCPICYDNLGSGEGSDRKIFLTRCGHLSCKSCLNRWIDQKMRNGSTVSCIECRKPISRSQLISVDPKKVDQDHSTDRKNEAIALVQQAAKMLEENYGQLEPHLWEALYLVIDLPPGVDRNLHSYFTAIPGLFLGHLRYLLAGQLPLDALPGDGMTATTKLPSKFRALLADLPRNELSVVFASSKSIVLHLQSVLRTRDMESKTLFVGQSERDSESAVSDWESDTDPATVLIVQAGAAACGLTLTAASKMFILEPFRKHEEEKQAYARLHRYGQKRAVHCKVYYTPVSIESRLLEWRRRAAAHAPQEEKTVYAPLRRIGSTTIVENDDGSDGYRSDDERSGTGTGGTDGNDDVEEETQTRFLLGLSTRTESTTITEPADDDLLTL